MYVCGPTVYDRAHLGNARAVVVYDVLFRLLRQIYGAEHVCYARNITDVDDKINAAAKKNNEPISVLTERVTGWFHADMAALNVLAPTHEPRATQHIAHMIAIIQRLLDKGFAYVSAGHVLFAVSQYAAYGALSGRNTDDLVAGARVAVESYKRDPGDFVLWKPADGEDDASSVFDSPWGKGRPGWHIECSAMSSEYLGQGFDIHGGGADLMFPHHENEIAQSCCAHGESAPLPPSGFAKIWMHNGFLTVNGEKMSKSLGNFITVHDLLERGVKGEVIRFALLSTHYRSPLDWNDKLLEDAKKTLDSWYRSLADSAPTTRGAEEEVEYLCDDLNMAKYFSAMHAASAQARLRMGRLIGFFNESATSWFHATASGLDTRAIDDRIAARHVAKKAKNWAEADRIRNALAAEGILLEDRPDGTTDWRKV